MATGSGLFEGAPLGYRRRLRRRNRRYSDLGLRRIGHRKVGLFLSVIPGLVGIVAALRVRKNNRCRSVRPNSFVAEVPLLMTWIPGTIAAIALIATLFLLLIVVSVGN